MKLPRLSNLKFKILTVFLLSTLYFLLSTPVLAQTNDPQVNNTQPINQVNPYLNPNTNPDVPKNQHTWVQTVMIDVMSAMSCQLTGVDPTNPKTQCLGVDPKTGNIGFVEVGGGAIGVAGKMIAMLYTPPLHTSDYFKYLANNFGIAKPAHAQGASGFQGLQPIQSLWIAFRDIVYLLFVIIFIIIGLAIMLRIRIDPRTVMTIQNQIPRIIIGILLLTFSFAIAGFLIDLMYVFIFLSYEIIAGASTGLSGLNPLFLQGATPFTASDGIAKFGVFGIAAKSAVSISILVSNLLSEFIEEILTGTSSGIPIIGGIIDKVMGWVVSQIASSIGALGGALTTVLAFIIISIALMFSLIRLWFILIITYISILLDVILAPFWIAASLLPGSPIGFGAWLRSIISNLAAFPAVIIMFLLAKVFIDAFGECKLPACNPGTAFVPPLVGDIPGTDVLGAIIGLGIILMTPGVVGMIKQALRAPAPSGAPIIRALDVATATPSELLRGGAYLGGSLYGLSHIGAHIPGLRGISQRIRGGGVPPPTTP